MRRRAARILSPVALRLSAAAAMLLLGVGLPGAAAAEEPLRLTIDDAVNRALEAGEEIRLARALTNDANGQVREAFSAALPQVTGSIGYTRQLSSLFQQFESDTGLSSVFENSPFAAANTWTAELKASQRLFSGGKIGAGIRAAHAVRRSAHAQEEESALEIAYNVRHAYLDAAYAGRLVEIAVGSLDQARDHLRVVRLQQGQGMTAEYDLLRAQVDAANQEPPAVAARNDYTLALLELKRLINLPLDQPLTLATPLGFADDMVPMLASAAETTATRPAVVAAEANVQARRQLLKVQRGFRWPDLTLSTTLSHQAFLSDGFPSRDQFQRNWEASLKLEFPIFLGLKTEGQIQRARADLERAQAERDQLNETVRIQVAEARAELERAWKLLFARRETVHQATRAMTIAGVRFTNGMSTELDVSDTRLQLNTAQVYQAQATRDYLLALAKLERAVGHSLQLTRRPLDQMSSLTPDGGEIR